MASSDSELSDYGGLSLDGEEVDKLVDNPGSSALAPPVLLPQISILPLDEDPNLNPPGLPDKTKRKRKNNSPKSWVWGTVESPHGIVTLVNGVQYWQCTRCSTSYLKDHGTHHPAQHLVNKHGLDEPEGSKLKRLKKSVNTIELSMEKAKKQLEIRQQKKAAEIEREQQLFPDIEVRVLEDIWVQLITRHDLPFTAPTWAETHSLFHLIRPEAAALLPQSAATVKSWILASFENEKENVKLLLRNALSQIHITIDLWTSPNNLAILGVVAHFTDEAGWLTCLLLAMVPLEGAHTGENMASAFLQVADDYNIRQNLGYFMMDNASNNDIMMSCIESSQCQIGLKFNTLERRLRCNGHVINLSVQAFLFGVSNTALDNITRNNLPAVQVELEEWRRIGPLGKVHNIQLHSRRSPQRVAKFRDLSGGTLIVKDNSTRWNSWADMLDSILKPDMRRAIRNYIDDTPELENDRITTADWTLLEHVQRILVAFRIATKETEGYDATLGKTLPSIDFLLNTYSVALEENQLNTMLSSMIRVGWEKLDKYYSTSSRAPVYLAAVVLHPRLKWRYFEVRWKPNWVRDGKRALRKYWIKYTESLIIEPIPPVPAVSGESNALNDWLDLEEFNNPEVNAEIDPLLQVQGEYDRYCCDTVPNRGIHDALKFWLDPLVIREYPTLSKWAISIESIPAMSSEPERVFSRAKKTISDLRHGLAADGIEATSCLKSWNRAKERKMSH